MSIGPATGGVLAERAWLRPLLRPGSVAVVGAMRRHGSVGYETVRALRDCGFTGRLYPVDESGRPVSGVPAYRTIADLPQPVDLLVVAVPPRRVPQVLREAGRRGVRSAIVLSRSRVPAPTSPTPSWPPSAKSWTTIRASRRPLCSPDARTTSTTSEAAERPPTVSRHGRSGHWSMPAGTGPGDERIWTRRQTSTASTAIRSETGNAGRLRTLDPPGWGASARVLGGRGEQAQGKDID